MGKQFQLLFKNVQFNTDEGYGNDEGLASLLDRRYGNMRLNVHAENEDEALRDAINQIIEAAGFDVLDCDYEICVS